MSQPRLVNPSPPLVRKQLRRGTIALFMAAAFVYWVSLYLYVPTLPTYAQTKTESLVLVGSILSMYGLWQGIVRLPLGILVDSLGLRKPFIIIGLILAGTGAWMMGTADGPVGLLLGRSITGLAAAAWVPLLVAFNRLFPADEAIKATAILIFVNNSGRVFATSATGVLNIWGGFSLPFFLAAVVAGLGILFMLPISEPVLPPKRPSIVGITRLITRKDVLLPSILAAASQYANWTTTFGFTPILAGQLGASDIVQSLLVTLNLLVTIVSNLLATRLIRRVGTRPLILVSFCVLAVGISLVTTASSLSLIFAAQIFIGLSQGINLPVLMGLSIRFVADSERNTAMGLHQSVYAVGMFAGPWLSGILAQTLGLQPMLLITALGTLMTGLLVGSKLDDKSLAQDPNH